LNECPDVLPSSHASPYISRPRASVASAVSAISLALSIRTDSAWSDSFARRCWKSFALAWLIAFCSLFILFFLRAVKEEAHETVEIVVQVE
jgi:hypothetical protein